MKDYHFEPDERDFDKTIRLDDINEELKKMEKELPVDELGDANDFLNVFESEQFGREPKGQPQEMIQRASDPRNMSQKNLPPKKEPEKTPLNKKNMALLAAVGVVMAMLAFILVGKLFSGGENGVIATEDAMPMLVQGVLDGGELVVYDITQDVNKTVALMEETVITDELGRVVPESDLTVGDLVLIGLDKSGKNALTIDFGGQITMVQETGLTVDQGTRTLKGEKAAYTYHPKTMIIFNEEELRADALESCDQLLLKSIGDTVWSIEVLEYHGYILVENKENIVNGMFTLDEEEPKPLAEVSRIAVTEGTHTISVSGDNIEKRKDSVFVGTGEELVYDLSKAQEKVGVLIVNANATEYKLYINGTLVDSTAPAVLPLGEYDLVILKNGYMEWSQHVVLKGDTLSVDANLQKEIQYGTLTVTADVDGGKVFIDQKEVGTVPLEVNLPYGSYHLMVSKNGYDAYESTIVISGPSVFVKAELGSY